MSLVFNQPERVSEWVWERVRSSSDGTAFTAIGFEDAGDLIAGAVFNCYTGPDITVTFAAAEGSRWARREWVEAIFSYVFTQLGCLRCSGEVSVNNAPSIATIEAMGFVREGVKRRAMADGSDCIIYGMLRTECRYLRAH